MWQHIKLSDVRLGTRPQYSLVAEEDVKKTTKQTINTFVLIHNSYIQIIVFYLFCFRIILSIIFFGLNFAVSSFVGNLYMNIFLMNLLQVLADLMAFFAIERWVSR